MHGGPGKDLARRHVRPLDGPASHPLVSGAQLPEAMPPLSLRSLFLRLACLVLAVPAWNGLASRCDAQTYELINSTYLGGPGRNDYGDRLPSRLKVLWKLNLGTGQTRIGPGLRTWRGAGWTGQPLLVRENGELFLSLGANDHHLRKIRASDGEVVWRYAFDDVIKGTGTFFHNPQAAAPEDRLLVIQGSRLGVDSKFDQDIVPSLRGISFATGRERWRMNCRRTATYSRDVDGSPLIVGDRAYLALENSIFTVFSPDPALLRERDGIPQPRIFKEIAFYDDKEARARRGNVECESSPTRLGDRLYTASGGGKVYGYSLKWNRVTWTFAIGSDLNATMPVTGDGCLLLAVEKQFIPGPGGVLKLDPSRSGQKAVRWFFPTEDVPADSFYEWRGGIIGSAATNEKTARGARPMATFMGVDGFLYLVASGELEPGRTVIGPDGATPYPCPRLLDRAPLGAGSIATPIFVGNRIAAPHDRGLKLFEVTPEGRLRLLDELAGSQFEATPVCHEGRLYAASLDGYLYCFGEE